MWNQFLCSCCRCGGGAAVLRGCAVLLPAVPRLAHGQDPAQRVRVLPRRLQDVSGDGVSGPEITTLQVHPIRSRIRVEERAWSCPELYPSSIQTKGGCRPSGLQSPTFYRFIREESAGLDATTFLCKFERLRRRHNHVCT